MLIGFSQSAYICAYSTMRASVTVFVQQFGYCLAASVMWCEFRCERLGVSKQQGIVSASMLSF